MSAVRRVFYGVPIADDSLVCTPTQVSILLADDPAAYQPHLLLGRYAPACLWRDVEALSFVTDATSLLRTLNATVPKRGFLNLPKARTL